MDKNRQLPISLKIVAILFILGGIFAVIEVIVSLFYDRFSINFGVLGLFIGPGLLALRPGWRTCALVFLWIAMIALPIIAIFMLANSGPLDFLVFGQKVGHAPTWLGISAAAILFLLSVWQYRVLTRPDVRAIFRVGPRRGYGRGSMGKKESAEIIEKCLKNAQENSYQKDR